MPISPEHESKTALHLSTFRSHFLRQAHNQLHREECRVSELQWVAGERGEVCTLPLCFLNISHSFFLFVFPHQLRALAHVKLPAPPQPFPWPTVGSSQHKQHHRRSCEFEDHWLKLFWLFFCFLCERWAALPALCSLFAGDFYLTALLIPRWIGSLTA